MTGQTMYVNALTHPKISLLNSDIKRVQLEFDFLLHVEVG